MEQKDVAAQTVPAIYKAISGVINDVGYVAKDKVNKQQGFKYRSVDDVFNALHPALAKNKVFIVPKILERECSVVGKTQRGTEMVKVVCKIKFTFYAEDGSSVESIIIGEGLDTGDKATNKAMAIAYKYACFQVFCIPTEEMTDPDLERPETELKSESASERKSRSKEKKEDKTGTDVRTECQEQEEPSDDRITPAMLQTIRNEQKRTGVTDQLILSRKAVKSKSVEELTIEEYRYIMSVFQMTKDRKEAAHE